MKYGRLSLGLTALTLPSALLLSSLVSWYYKANNPDDVDITQGLAYLRPILVTGLVAFLVPAIVALVSGLLGLRRDEDPTLARYALVLLAIATLLGLLAGVANGRAGSAEDDYRNVNPAASRAA